VAQVASAQDYAQQGSGGDANTYGQNSGADTYINYGGNNTYNGYNTRGNTNLLGYSGRVNSASPSATSSSAWGGQGATSRVVPNSYGNARTRQGVQVQGRSTLGNSAVQRRRGGKGPDDRDIIIDGDDNVVIIWPDYGYGGYYPRYNWVNNGGWITPVRNYPGYGYPSYGQPGYGHPGYGYPGYGYPGGGYVGHPSYGGSWPGYIYGPGTYSTRQTGTVSGGFGGFSLGTGGVNVSLGGGRQSVNSQSTTTVMPGTTVVAGGLSPFVMPGNYPQSNPYGVQNNSTAATAFVMPNRGSRGPNTRGTNYGVRSNARGF
jgi:hypothetical protein